MFTPQIECTTKSKVPLAIGSTVTACPMWEVSLRKSYYCGSTALFLKYTELNMVSHMAIIELMYRNIPAYSLPATESTTSPGDEQRHLPIIMPDNKVIAIRGESVKAIERRKADPTPYCMISQ